jgi:hypothetical protein
MQFRVWNIVALFHANAKGSALVPRTANSSDPSDEYFSRILCLTAAYEQPIQSLPEGIQILSPPS